ncbi:MAG: hypothetical protein OES09_12745 [Gammaproteobacteria bacterium]|nr:hypothetical protein [Gammaproteobacteria bacterium]
MFLTLNLTRRILSRFPDDEFHPDFASNRMLLLVDPGRFAARAYRHFVRPENRETFLQSVIAGDALGANGGIIR